MQTQRRTRITHPVDHLGNQFNSMSEMCEHYHLKKSVFMDRRQRGWTLQECLEGRDSRIGKNGKVFDHKGNEYLSEKAMCEKYEIKYETYSGRKRRGLSLEECLAKPKENPVYDHNRQKFPNKKALCAHYNVDPSTFQNRIDKGWPLKKALTTPSRKDPSKLSCKDHLGNTFASQSEMCKHYNIEIGTFQRRLERGWTTEQALTNELQRFTYEDPFGKEFSELKDMLKYYNVKFSTYHSRIKSGRTPAEALGIVPMLTMQTRNIQFTDDVFILRPIPDPKKGKAFYFECVIDDTTFIRTRPMLVEHYLEHIRKERSSEN